MLVVENRPRNLHWFHAGPLLFGDWGTSRLYVLGLAFYFTGHASPLYLAVMSAIMVAVAWAYSVVCRCFPDGGGVYAAARRLNPTLSVIGATLLLCDYIVTAALSAIEGFHYFGVPHHAVVWLSVATIGLIGIINWFGSRSAGRFALAIAAASILVSLVLGLMCLPFAFKGLQTVTSGDPSITGWWTRWESLVRIILALSGVEAVANMTGLMTQPVARTSKRTIWPVLVEVIILNMVFGLALNAMPGAVETAQPDHVTYEIQQGLSSDQVPHQVKEYRDTAVRVLAIEAGQHWFGEQAGRVFGLAGAIVFGLLLLSAVNTAVMAMVSVMYSMARDRELPQNLAKLNYSGVPWIALLAAAAFPASLLIIEADVKALAELYAIGVVGAIAINVLSCALNSELAVSKLERAGLWSLGLFMSGVEVTIIYAKPKAAVFAAVMIAVVLFFRFLARIRAKSLADRPMAEPELGWMAHMPSGPLKLDLAKPKIMLAARGRDQAEYAVDLARQRGAVLFAVYVRTLRVLDVGPGQVPRIEDDRQAQEALGTVAVVAQHAGVPFVPIYVTSTDIAAEILDYTVTYGCDTLIMGKSRRTLFSRTLAGDVISGVARNLPDSVALLTRSAGDSNSHRVHVIDSSRFRPPDDEKTTSEQRTPRDAPLR